MPEPSLSAALERYAAGGDRTQALRTIDLEMQICPEQLLFLDPLEFPLFWSLVAPHRRLAHRALALLKHRPPPALPAALQDFRLLHCKRPYRELY